MSNTHTQKYSTREFEIEVTKESLHFSAGHFTIFGAQQRENLHGHNFRVEAVIECEIGEDGLTFDYSIIKAMLQKHCDALDEQVLLPAHSPYLQIGNREGYIQARFGDETLLFLPRDVLVLPIRNVTVEELSNWFIDQLQTEPEFNQLPISKLTIRVASGSGQWGIARVQLH